MKMLLVSMVVGLLFFSSFLSTAKADQGLHFHCSVCGSHNHGSMWHDSERMV